MIVIDPTLLGRKFYVMDPKIVYTCRGFIVSGTNLVIGEYADPTYKCNRLATHKLSDAKFTDYVPTTPTPP
jgi:hypothetical protein